MCFFVFKLNFSAVIYLWVYMCRCKGVMWRSDDNLGSWDPTQVTMFDTYLLSRFTIPGLLKH